MTPTSAGRCGTWMLLLLPHQVADEQQLISSQQAVPIGTFVTGILRHWNLQASFLISLAFCLISMAKLKRLLGPAAGLCVV